MKGGRRGEGVMLGGKECYLWEREEGEEGGEGRRGVCCAFPVVFCPFPFAFRANPLVVLGRTLSLALWCSVVSFPFPSSLSGSWVSTSAMTSTLAASAAA